LSGEHGAPLRVLLVSANYRPSVGGIERFVETLAEALAARGHGVTVVCCRTGDAPLAERRKGVSIVRVRASELPRRLAGVPYPLPAPLALWRTTRRLVRRSDVVHVQDAVYATSVAALVSAHAAGVPSVLTQHVGFVPQASRPLDAAQRLGASTVGRVARLADRVATYNDAVADWAATQWGIVRPALLPSGVERPTATAAERRAVRQELGLGADELAALFVGRDVPKKRLDVFLGSAGPASMRLVAVTDRPLGPSAGAIGVPFLPPERFRQLLASMDAFVLPSTGEGFPLALQEALLGGIPCVVAPHQGYERYLAVGDVLEVEPTSAAVHDALVRLKEEPALRARLSERARAVGDHWFGVDAFADSYLALYRELVSRR
jgi:glycosyltransferase involved in cell wall biosynthesis